MALVDDGLAVGGVGPRPLDEVDRVGAETHRPAQVFDLLLLGQKVDDRVGRLGVHLRRVGPLETNDIAGELGNSDVHTEANAEIRDPALARDPARRDLPLPTARAEAPGDEDSVGALELLGCFLEAHSFGVDPANAHARPVMTTG